MFDRKLTGVAEELLEYSSVPVVFKPNAGLPKLICGKTVFDVGAEEFAEDVGACQRCRVFRLLRHNAGIYKGCCKTKELPPVPVTDKNLTVVSSYTHAAAFGDAPVLIGERINPTGKSFSSKRFEQ